MLKKSKKLLLILPEIDRVKLFWKSSGGKILCEREKEAQSGSECREILEALKSM